jgi:hypothetical protein
VAERPIAPVLKTGGPKGSVCSNHTTSANPVTGIFAICSCHDGQRGCRGRCVKAVRFHRMYVKSDPGGNRDDFAGLKGMGIPSCLRSRSFSVRGRGPAPEYSASGGTGIHGSLKSFRSKEHAGSKPALPTKIFRTVAQLVDALDLKPESSMGCRFEPGQSDQMIMSCPHDLRVIPRCALHACLPNRDASARDFSSGASHGRRIQTRSSISLVRAGHAFLVA